MRRAPIVLTATVLGTAGVLLFKPMSTTALGSTGTTEAAGTDSSAAEATGSSSSSSSTSSSPATRSSASASASNGAKDGTYTGAAETTRFGTTQVKVTVSGGRITAITAVQLNQNDPRSVQISEAAAPMLRSEVLSKQTAAVDTVSGATYTSVAYEASVQSALDAAGFRAADGSKASTDVSTFQEGGGH